MSITLNSAQREQAGSDTYNRYEYQVHWIVCQIISRLSQNPQCIIFCEYHDDMAEIIDPNQEVFEYYQIKTRDDGAEWTVVDLSKKSKRANGTYKNSFLGFIFYNFMHFGLECSHCSFVSNAPMDQEIRTWQACIEDDEQLKDKEPLLYSKIKQRIAEEYGVSKPDCFDDIFERFIQNTFVYSDDLQINSYEEQTKSRFFTYLSDQKLPTDTAHLIFEQIINDVRRKSKEKIDPPVSKKALISKKGVRVSDLSTLLKSKTIRNDIYDEFRNYLNDVGLSDSKANTIVFGKIAHDTRWNNIEDINYQTCVVVVRSIISEYIASNNDDFAEMLLKCTNALSAHSLSLSSLDNDLIEVLYYERKFANSVKGT